MRSSESASAGHACRLVSIDRAIGIEVCDEALRARNCRLADDGAGIFSLAYVFYGHKTTRPAILPGSPVALAIAQNRALGSTGIAGAVPSATHVNIILADFFADDGAYDMNWPGPPRRAWQDGDKEYYTTRVTLDAAAPEDFTVPFWVKQNRRWWFDPTLGAVFVAMPVGQLEGEGQFWLVCTKKGKVTASDGKNGREARVYLEHFSFISDVDQGNWTYSYKSERREHDVRCN